MAMIKSALEIALERTRDLKADPRSLAAAEAKQEGKKLAGDFLNDTQGTNFGKSFAAIPKEKKEKAKEGAFEVFASRIQLPSSIPNDLKAELEPIELGIKALSAVPFGEKRIQEVFSQLGSFLGRYLEDAKHIEESINKQYAPRLKAKEQEMSARLGRAVRIDPMDDPEFANFYKQNVGQMRKQYQTALDKAKAELASMCGIKKED